MPSTRAAHCCHLPADSSILTPLTVLVHGRVRGTAVTQMNRGVHSPSCQLCLNLTAGNWSPLTQLVFHCTGKRKDQRRCARTHVCAHVWGGTWSLSQANVSHPYTTLHSSPDTGSTGEVQLTDVQLPAKITGACTNVPVFKWVLGPKFRSWCLSALCQLWLLSPDDIWLSANSSHSPNAPYVLHILVSYLSRLACSTQQWIRLTSLLTF